jgi:outer membrane protein OmpA-like peptidoglycan-associated protein
MLKLRTLGIAMALVLGASGVVLTTGCGETVLQVGTTPPPEPPAPPPPPAPEPEPVAKPEPPPEPPPLVEVKGDEIKINDKINFAKNSADIEASSNNLIENIANVMKKHADIDFVEVAGHASNEGDEFYNKNLTQRRAKAVMDALVALGVEKNRMRAVGYGFYCELQPDNHEVNRRVEFKILRRAGKDTAVKGGGCEAADKKGLTAKPIPADAKGGASEPAKPATPKAPAPAK